MSKELAPAEASRLKACERVIERGMGTFVEVGDALANIRDQKLYRASHKTFDAYCKERWNLGRARAYQLIEGAQTVKTIADAVGADLSTAVDKLPERHVRELKADPIAAASEIKERAAKGEEPAAVVKDIASRAQAGRQDQQFASKPIVAPKIDRSSDHDDMSERLEELEAINDDLTAENTKLKAQVAALEPMRLEFERGGFAEVIKGLGEQIRVLKTRVESESKEKVKNLRSAEYWKQKAIEAGYSRNAVIDLETGDIANG